MHLTYSYRAGLFLAALACAIAAWPGLAQTAEGPRAGQIVRRSPPARPTIGVLATPRLVQP